MSQFKILQGSEEEVAKSLGYIGENIIDKTSYPESVKQIFLDMHRTAFVETKHGDVKKRVDTWTTGKVENFKQGQSESSCFSIQLANKFYINKTQIENKGDYAEDFEKNIQIRFAYFNDYDQPMGLSIIYLPKTSTSPERWMFSISKNTHLPLENENRSTIIVGSGDLFQGNEANGIKEDKSQNIQNNTIQYTFLNNIESEEVKNILNDLFDEQGKMNSKKLENLTHIIKTGQTIDLKEVSRKGTIQVAGLIKMQQEPTVKELGAHRDLNLPQFIFHDNKLSHYNPKDKEIVELEFKKDGLENFNKIFNGGGYKVKYLRDQELDAIKTCITNENLDFGEKKLKQIDYSIPHKNEKMFLMLEKKFITYKEKNKQNINFEKLKENRLIYEKDDTIKINMESIAINNKQHNIQPEKIKNKITIEKQNISGKRAFNAITIVGLIIFGGVFTFLAIFAPPLFILAVTIASIMGASIVGLITKTIVNEITYKSTIKNLNEEKSKLEDENNKLEDENNKLEDENLELNKNKELDSLFERASKPLLSQNFEAKPCGLVIITAKKFETANEKIKENEIYFKSSCYIYVLTEKNPELHYYNALTNEMTRVNNPCWSPESFNNGLFGQDDVKDIEILDTEQLQFISEEMAHVHCDTYIQAFENNLEKELQFEEKVENKSDFNLESTKSSSKNQESDFNDLHQSQEKCGNNTDKGRETHLSPSSCTQPNNIVGKGTVTQNKVLDDRKTTAIKLDN